MSGLTAEHPTSATPKAAPMSEAALIALWSWVNHHPKATFAEFKVACVRAAERTTSN